MAAPFDAERLVLRGEPVAVLGDVMQARRHRNSGDETWAGQYDVANGTLAFLTGGIHPPGRSALVVADRQGAVTPLNLGPGFYHAPRLSPDRKHIAYFAEDDNRAADVWVYDVESQTARRLTFDGGEWPTWSPDGRTLLYSRRGQLRTIAADGNGVPVAIHLNASTEDVWMVPCSWVGANALAVSLKNPGIWSLAMDGTAIATPFLQRDHTLGYPAASPDEHWIAYSSWETGAADVWVQRNAPNGERIRVSTKGLNNASGGSSPKWTQDGSELAQHAATRGGPRHRTGRQLPFRCAANSVRGTFQHDFPGQRLRRLSGWPAVRHGQRFHAATSRDSDSTRARLAA